MGYDFESDKKYNIEGNISVTIDLPKTCYSPGETLNGKIVLRQKTGNTQALLSDPRATIFLTEYACYDYMEEVWDPISRTNKYKSLTAEDEHQLLMQPCNFSNFYNANLGSLVEIPFQFVVPLNSYPSCIFDSSTYVKHYLCIDFPGVQAKKTVVIIIKNPKYFNDYNKLYQAPATCYKEATKHKLFFSKGSYNATLKLPRNAFSYDEMIPFTIDIDASKLSMNIKAIKISLNRNSKKNFQHNHNELRSENKKELVSRRIELQKGQKTYHLEDCLQFQGDSLINPKDVYSKLDGDKRKYSEKYSGVKLFPSCYGGLLSCEYYVKMTLEMDSMLSTDEKLKINVDVYDPYVPPYNANAPPQPYGAPPQPYGPPQPGYPQAPQPYGPPQPGYPQPPQPGYPQPPQSYGPPQPGYPQPPKPYAPPQPGYPQPYQPPQPNYPPPYPQQPPAYQPPYQMPPSVPPANVPPSNDYQDLPSQGDLEKNNPPPYQSYPSFGH